MLEKQLALLGMVSLSELQNNVYCVLNPALKGAWLAVAEVQTGCIILHIRRSGSCQVSITCFILKYHPRKMFSAGNFSFFRNLLLVAKL